MDEQALVASLLHGINPCALCIMFVLAYYLCSCVCFWFLGFAPDLHSRQVIGATTVV